MEFIATERIARFATILLHPFLCSFFTWEETISFIHVVCAESTTYSVALVAIGEIIHTTKVEDFVLVVRHVGLCAK